MQRCAGALVLLAVFGGIFIGGCSHGKGLQSGPQSAIGVVESSFSDTFRTGIRNAIYTAAEEKSAQVHIWSGNNSQATQNEKIALFIQQKVGSLAINPVDRSQAGSVIDSVKQAGIPVVFYNAEPQLADLQKWDRVYYVGAKPEQAGRLQGEILIRYFKEHPPQDSIIRYVMIEGEPGHQDAVARTKYVIAALEEAGFKTEKVAAQAAMWNRSKAQSFMETVLAAPNGRIDCVIANNDDMALGAIDALKVKGYFQNGLYMPVVGVDATGPALRALAEGTLLGTVLNDARTQGQAIFNLSSVLAQGQTPDSNNCGFPITDGKYIWIDYKIITKQNLNDVK